MRNHTRTRRIGFTIIELLVVVSIIALLVGILLPAIGKAREQAQLTRSVANLKEIGNAHAIYGAEWNDRQITWINDGIAQYGNSLTAAMSGYAAEVGEHPYMNLGWDDMNSFWYYVPEIVATPIHFTGQWAGWGAFRCHNCQAFGQYLNGRHYDQIWFAPKDRIVVSAVERCFENPGDFCWPEFPTQTVLDCSYSLAASAMFNPAVFGFANEGVFQEPFDLNAGLKSPSASQAEFPTLKTRVLEHHWLNGGTRADCNANYAGTGPYDGCQPYFFNQGWNSAPVALFYDGHVESIGVRETIEADERSLNQTGIGTWSRDTPLGDYYHESRYELFSVITATSFHVLTTYGIKGKDKDAR